jgi:hypothetical protein
MADYIAKLFERIKGIDFPPPQFFTEAQRRRHLMGKLHALRELSADVQRELTDMLESMTLQEEQETPLRKSEL